VTERAWKVFVGPAAALSIAAVSIISCQAKSGTNAATESTASSTASSSPTSHYVDAGDSMRFIAHDENLPPGFPANGKPLVIKNPYENDKDAIRTGGQLYVSYNCVDCHGVDGSGSMAPTFQDSRWHFGGTSAEIFESIYQGRPDGMPAWGSRISNDQIWMLAAYVRSLSAGDITTENFTGKTVERTGH
jgi:mono/diheme cytochrome c family protein